MSPLLPQQILREWNQTPDFPPFLRINSVIEEILIKDADKQQSQISAALETNGAMPNPINPATLFASKRVLDKGEYIRNYEITELAKINEASISSKQKIKKKGLLQQEIKKLKRTMSFNILADLSYAYCIKQIESGEAKFGQEFNTQDERVQKSFKKLLLKNLKKMAMKHRAYSFLSKEYGKKASFADTMQYEQKGKFKNENRAILAGLIMAGMATATGILFGSLISHANPKVTAGFGMTLAMIAIAGLVVAGVSLFFLRKKLNNIAKKLESKVSQKQISSQAAQNLPDPHLRHQDNLPSVSSRSNALPSTQLKHRDLADANREPTYASVLPSDSKIQSEEHGTSSHTYAHVTPVTQGGSRTNLNEEPIYASVLPSANKMQSEEHGTSPHTYAHVTPVAKGGRSNSNDRNRDINLGMKNLRAAPKRPYSPPTVITKQSAQRSEKEVKNRGKI